MNVKVDDYYKKYGEGTYSQADLARELGIHEATISQNKKKMIAQGLLVEGEHYFKTAAGKLKFTDSGYNVMSRYKELI
jgi:Mn-dependent DtxR family transcriptional regulator